MNYTLIRSSRKTVGIEIKNGCVIVRAPERLPKAEIERILSANEDRISRMLEKAAERESALGDVIPLTDDEIRTLAEKALLYIPGRVKYYAGLMGVTYGRITVRNQKTRWGSCSSKGNLNFNCLLMLTPPEVIDSVVVHELCHLREMNHSPKFYAEVLKVYPDYHKWNGWLKEHGAAIMKRMTG